MMRVGVMAMVGGLVGGAEAGRRQQVKQIAIQSFVLESPTSSMYRWRGWRLPQRCGQGWWSGGVTRALSNSAVYRRVLPIHSGPPGWSRQWIKNPPIYVVIIGRNLTRPAPARPTRLAA